MAMDDSLRELFEVEYSGLVRLAFLLTGNTHTAEEIAQEAFVRAADRWGRLQDYDKPGAWLRLVVARLATRQRWKTRRERDLTRLPDIGALDPVPPDPLVYEALRAISEPQRCCIVLHHLEDMSVADVAKVMKMPQGTVRSHLHRGREELGRVLGNEKTLENRKNNSRSAPNHGK